MINSDHAVAEMKVGAETVALDLDDVRKGHLIVRYGKGGEYREVPLHPKLRVALESWLPERAKVRGTGGNPALFLNHRGGRLSARGAYDALKAVATDADLSVNISRDLIDQAKDAFWLAHGGYRTFSAWVEHALRRHIDATKAAHGVDDLPRRPGNGPLPPGRPLG